MLSNAIANFGADAISFCSLCVTVGIVLQRKRIFSAGKSDQDKQADLKLERRLTRLETKVDLYWNSVERSMSDHIHSPHTPEIDALLEKISAGDIDLEGRRRLRMLLSDVLKAEDPTGHTAVAVATLAAIQDAKIGLLEVANSQ